MRYFTKSAFKEALLCPARLNYYHNDEYANQAVFMVLDPFQERLM
ncbi:hypothetical protein MMG03_001285 [Fibrobacter succinogenes]|nr:hypothetical protein [Fibrobacter succinogenes]SHL37010.1 hypothetical protein SAMN05720764_11281 [Fibrobacter sp. UWH5]